ncbi:MAG: hypothetical protein IID61_08675, partial [SAR324 cluster bacterium]|nr:hypothetical protein [SAR324 cluster bacterium]
MLRTVYDNGYSATNSPATRVWYLAAVLMAALALAACGGGGGSGSGGGNGGGGEGEPSTAVNTIVLEPGDEDCPFGGILVESGIDDNGNGLLDPEEVDETEKVCNGSDG